MCCENDYCNSKYFANIELGDVTVVSLPINSIRYGISGRSLEHDLCATLVLVEPKSEDCVSQAGSAYLTVKQGARNCAWEYAGRARAYIDLLFLSTQRTMIGDHQLTSLSGCWKGLHGPQPEVSLNVATRSPLFSGTLRFASAPRKPRSSQGSTVEVEERMRKQPSSVRHFNQRNPVIEENKSHRRVRFAVTTKHAADKVKATATNSLTVRISSPSGIGSATLSKVNGGWPRTKHILLNLRGLEDFQVTLLTLFFPIIAFSKGVQWQRHSSRERLQGIRSRLVGQSRRAPPS